MLFPLAIAIFCLYQSHASFLQCSPSDSLESLGDLHGSENAEKQAITCEKWPFYSGGFVKHDSRSRSDSSSSEERHDSRRGSDSSSLLQDVSSDSILYGFDDAVETHKCVEFTENYCNKWIYSKKEYEDKGGCDRDADSAVMDEYQLCLCADNNYGETQNAFTVDTTPSTTSLSNEAVPIAKYCSAWACLETAQYPSNYAAYSLMKDNDMIAASSSSSSEDEEDSVQHAQDNHNGDYYRFAENGALMQLDEAMELQNCWCKAASLNGEYCLNWYCESLEHDAYGCHGTAFGVDDYGWFGCYEDAQDVHITTCNSWYGFLLDDENREEYRCECVDEECISWICGLKEIELRRNYMWYNFWCALIIWGCLCGCCGTKICFKKKCFDGIGVKLFQCRKCRMFVFYVLIGVIALIHGGVPAFLFFIMISSCSLYCAYKCENCKCCRSKCSMGSKWKEMKKKCEMRCAQDSNDIDGKTNTVITTKDGENSKEDSQSQEVEQAKTTKSGHIRIATVDLDEMDGDGDDTNV